MNFKQLTGFSAKWVIYGILGLFLIAVLADSVGNVNAGYVGVKTRFGKVVSTTQPGLYFKLPFIENITPMDVQTQKEETDATAASNDLQSVTAKVAVNFHLEGDSAGAIFQNVGVDYPGRIIDPAIQESIKAVTANYTAEQLITKREEVRDGIKALLTQKLQTFGIQTDSLNIVNFDFSKSFNDAIEAKVTAEQNALAAKNKLDQVKYEAEQTIAKAKGDAEAIQIQAQAIQQQGGAAYVQLQAVKAWNGILPVYMMGNTVPFVNIK